jgi:hypothetical protein
MELTMTAYELKKNAKDMIELYKKKIGEEVIDDECVDAETLGLIRGIFNMCDLAMELTCEQAEAIDEINRKLDKLLETK